MKKQGASFVRSFFLSFFVTSIFCQFTPSLPPSLPPLPLEPDGYAVIALADTRGETTTPYLELHTRSLNILTEIWQSEPCPDAANNVCTETVDIVSMAIHLLNDTAIDVYYVQRTDKVRTCKNIV